MGDICVELAHVIVGVRKSEVCREAGLPEMQVRADIALLGLQSIGQAIRVETQAGMICYSLQAEFLLWATCFASQAVN